MTLHESDWTGSATGETGVTEGDGNQGSADDGGVPDDESSFRTKKGWCRLTDQALVVQNRHFGGLRRLYEWNRAALAGYVLLLVTFFAVLAVRIAGDPGSVLSWAAFTLPVVAWLVFNRFVRGFRSRDHIPLDAIEWVSAHDGTFTQTRFVVTYRRDGDVRRRYVTMPSTLLSRGQSEFERAKRVFRNRGLLNE